MDAEELAHKRELVALHTHQRREREKQAAKYGLDCPPYILTEIADLDKHIQQLLREIGDTPDAPQANVPMTLPVPVLEESRQFAELATLRLRKDLVVHPIEQDIRNSRRVLDADQQSACARSVWEFDRVALYLYEEHIGTTSIEHRALHVRQEVERLQARNHTGSLIPLYYAARSVLTLLSAGQGALAEGGQYAELFVETLEYIGLHPDLEKGEQVKRNLRKILTILGVTAP